MKIVVTGGLGYLGSHVTKILKNKGHEVTVIDKGMYRNSDAVNIDIRNPKIEDYIKNSDAVIHLAAIVGDSACDIDKKETKSINFSATKRIAELCAKNDRKLIFASTCSVYGENKDELEINENETSKNNPVSLYGETKRDSEKAILETDANATILRLGTLFGLSKRMRYDLAINLFIAQALNNESLTVFGGKQWRPFLHVKDAAEAFVSLISKDKKGVYNIAWKNLRILDVAKLISKELNVNYSIDSDKKDIRNYKVSTGKISKLVDNKRTIKNAIDEIKDSETWKNYREIIYNNYQHLSANTYFLKND